MIQWLDQFQPTIVFPKNFVNRKRVAHLHLSPSKRKIDRISGTARPVTKGVARKIHEARLLFRPGGQAVLSPRKGAFRCRDARCARLILRKHGGSPSGSFPADAFSAQRPCFRATSLVFTRKGNHKSEGGQEIETFALGQPHFLPSEWRWWERMTSSPRG